MYSVIFDLDGTLADTSADLIAAANACFAARNLDVALDPTLDAATAFAGGRAMLRLGYQRLGGVDVEEMVEADFNNLLVHYGENIDVHTTLYDGVVDTLDRLEAAGYLLGVCTNKPEGLALELLKRLDLLKYFKAMLGADTLDVRKPDAKHLTETILRVGGTQDKAVLIGDTITDRNAAANANVPCILVSFGPMGRAVEDMHPAALLDHYHDLPKVLEHVFGTAQPA